MAGYSGTPLIKKLGLKEGFRVRYVNQPVGFPKLLGELPANVQVFSRLASSLNLIVLFVTSRRELERKFRPLVAKLKHDGMIWVAWPKKSSGILTDLSFDPVQKLGLNAGLVDVKICAIDETWSGLKFVYRLKDRSTN
ncbi:MAG TPA: hypothetical protein VIV66_17465 [Pyrinomonadaceae bacterium]